MVTTADFEKLACKTSKKPLQEQAAVAVLYARSDSVYKTLEGVDVWDIDRDARLFEGDLPTIAHPPCRAWGRLRKFAKPAPGEKNAARLAVAIIRRNGGVLEHPHGSLLWADQMLPIPGARDQFGGWSLPITQMWFGHKAEKKRGCISWDASRKMFRKCQ